MKVKFVNEKDLPSGYGGINYYAARELGEVKGLDEKGLYKKLYRDEDENTIFIIRGQSNKETTDTIEHEVIEYSIMKTTKIKYMKAHELTNTIQRYLKAIKEIKYDVYT
jgi:hypothetical protein